MSLRPPPSSPAAVGSPAVAQGIPGQAVDAGDQEVLDEFRAGFRDTDYFSAGREWTDYGPAYRCGLEASAARVDGSGRFRDVEAELEQQWAGRRDGSRLCWTEARGAVAHAWNTGCGAEAPARQGLAVEGDEDAGG